MSKLIDGKYTVQIPFSTGTAYISSDVILESDSNQVLSNVINTLQAGDFSGNLTLGDASGDTITVNAGTTTYVNNEVVNLKDNSATALTFSSTGNSNMLVLDTSDGSEKVKVNKELHILNTTQSTSQTTGSLQVSGGIGQANGKDFYAGNDIYLPNNRKLVLSDASTTFQILRKASYGLAIQETGTDRAVINGNGILVYAPNLYLNYGSASGSGYILGGSNGRRSLSYDISNDYTSLWAGANVEKVRITNTDNQFLSGNPVKILDTTQSTTQTTGSLQVSGGIAQASGKDIFCGRDVIIPYNRAIILDDATTPCKIQTDSGVGLAFYYNGTRYGYLSNNGLTLTPTPVNFAGGQSTGTAIIRFGSSLTTGFGYDITNSMSILYGGASVQKVSVSNTANTFISTNNNLFNNTTDASSSSDTSASVYTAGGISCVKKIYTGTGIYLPTSGGTASALNYYEEWSSSTTFQSSVGGGTTAVRTIVINRIGKMCTLSIPEFQINANGGQIVSNTAIVPTRFRPANGLTLFPIFVQDAGTIQSSCGVLSLYTGVISILKSPVGSGNFSVGVDSGCVAGSDIIVSYCVN